MNKQLALLLFLGFVFTSTQVNGSGQRIRQVQPLVCSPACQNGGTCIKNPSNTNLNICKCTDQWTGPACGRKVICDYKCLNGGTCIKSIDIPSITVCSCAPGYTGINCRFNLRCDSTCQNGGKCINNPLTGLNKCECNAGYTGSDCSSIIDNCIPTNPCTTAVFPKCISVLNGVICTPSTSKLACRINNDRFNCLTNSG